MWIDSVRVVEGHKRGRVRLDLAIFGLCWLRIVGIRRLYEDVELNIPALAISSSVGGKNCLESLEQPDIK